MTRIKDLTGQTFGTLTVTAYAGTKHHMAQWHVVCECGNERIVRGTYLRDGTTKACGDAKAHPYTRHVDGKHAAYSAAHAALRATLGSASDYMCSGDDNQCNSLAQDWAYLGCDEEIAGPAGTGAFCPHACPDEYTPLCRTHHRALDRQRREYAASTEGILTRYVAGKDDVDEEIARVILDEAVRLGATDDLVSALGGAA